MKTRVITATVMVALMIPFLWFSHTIAFPILLAFLAALGVYEMQSCLGLKKQKASLAPAVLYALFLPFLMRYWQEKWKILFILTFALITYLFILSVFHRSYGVEEAGLTGMTTLYIGFGFASLAMLRSLAFGQWIYILAFIIPWLTDTFAYFCGRAFGKRKLIPEVSPKKTVEGAVGGTVCAVLLTLLYGFLVGTFAFVTPNYLGLAIISAAVSVLAQCGDLVMSRIKRKYGIKDYGKLFPGHGGVLDRFDSILTAAPFLYFLSSLFPSLHLFR